jgi:LPS-assembly protein
VKVTRPNHGWRSTLRLAVAAAALTLCAGPSLGQGLIPNKVFDRAVNPRAPMDVEADNLTFDGANNTITASGGVILKQGGYTVTGDQLIYDRNTNNAHFVGAVTVRDPRGNEIQADNLQLTGGMKAAFIDSLTITTYDGAQIRADSADYDSAVQTVLVNATYAPCGDCIDDKGRRIGWSVTAAKVTYNAEDGSVYLEQPRLDVLGVPIAWLPYLYLPDTSETVLEDVAVPSVSYTEQVGLRVSVPYTAYSSEWTDLILTPTLLTRQGFLLGAEWVQRFQAGQFRIKGSGLYQFNPEAFTYVPAQERWRGALQTSGSFRPISDWLVGWSYTAFTDPAYLPDYSLTDNTSTINEVYATHLSDDTFIDARLQDFNLLGKVSDKRQGQIGDAIPNVRFEHVEELAPGFGRIEISGRLLGVQREYDAVRTKNGVPINFGYAGNKQHVSLQAGWQNQWIGPGGLVLTPYLGGRGDFSYYDGTSPLLPGEQQLWAATPIAALDIRYPLVANAGSTVHLVEPIAQIVYRGSDTSLVGITNDDSQSFVFDDTNLFSYNRFTGGDRQETGLRANIGGRYLVDFEDGSYLEFIAGQSFHLAGVNAFGATDSNLTTAGSGLEDSASYAILGAYGSFTPGLTVGGKVQINTTDPQVARASFDASFENDEGYSATVKYDYLAANPDVGVLKAQHEVGAEVGIPYDEYWTITGSAYWDLASNTWLEFGGGLTYDDGYVVIGGEASRTGPTHGSPNDTRFMATFRLKAPAGLNVGYTGDVF